MSKKPCNRERNKIINFRVSEQEKKFIEARIEASNINKAEYYVRSCLYNRIVVVGKREHIDRLIEQLIEMELLLKALLEKIQSEDTEKMSMEIMQLRDDYIAMVTAIYEIAKAGNKDIK